VAAAAAEAAGSQLLQGVQQVWLAGMGAIARGQKDGPAAFQEAVAEGLKLLNRSRSTAQDIVRDAFEGAQESLQSRMGGAREQAQETWDNIEALFQTRVQRALQQLGVPSAEEIRLLARRVAVLAGPLAKPCRPLALLGRWSLSFYMLHQPILIGALLAWRWSQT